MLVGMQVLPTTGHRQLTTGHPSSPHSVLALRPVRSGHLVFTFVSSPPRYCHRKMTPTFDEVVRSTLFRAIAVSDKTIATEEIDWI